ncbi:hypothetical protein E1H18_121 [Caulobacter sp. RHG1]|nr:hypothetical protein [Caulobacter sp. RHG1]
MIAHPGCDGPGRRRTGSCCFLPTPPSWATVLIVDSVSQHRQRCQDGYGWR